MSAKKMWLPAWAAKIAGLSSMANDNGKLIEPGNLSDGEKKALALETSAPPPHEFCRCAACGGATELKEPTSQGEEVRRCVRCGQMTREEQ